MSLWGEALALQAADGVALRAAVAQGDGRRGHVILLNGRTEYLEKYGAVVHELVSRGFAVASLDWRGQGGSQRLLDDRAMGHVDDFALYQRDLDTLLAHEAVASLPRPRLLLAHSMGGAIGLRWLSRPGHGVAAAVFSAPMWGVHLSFPLNRLVPPIVRLGARMGLARRYAPGGNRVTYVLDAAEPNVLTSDPEAFAALKAFAAANPDKVLGGPSYGWLAAALREIRALRQVTVPVPTQLLLGTEETVVDPEAIRARAARGEAALLELPGARHEPLIETPEHRRRLWETVDAFLGQQGL